VLVFFLILFKRVHAFFSQKRENKKKTEISNFISEALKKKGLPIPSFPPNFLLEILEIYDRRLKGEEWEEFKILITKNTLLPKARKWGKSLSWKRRNFAARVFSLTHLPEDEEENLLLLEDRSFLVRSIASATAVKMESQKGILKTLQNMEQEPGYGRYYYADLLSQSTQRVFKWIVEIALTHPSLHLACLEVLAVNTVPIPMPFIKQDLQSKEEAIRLAALKVVIRNPQIGSISLFAECMEDSNEKIRILGGQGLGNYASNESIESLRRGLTDSSPFVRLVCAKSFKKLDKIDQVKDPLLKTYVEQFA
jgi:hypothetical protein